MSVTSSRRRGRLSRVLMNQRSEVWAVGGEPGAGRMFSSNLIMITWHDSEPTGLVPSMVISPARARLGP